MNGLLLLTIGLIVPVLFCLWVHFITRPYVKFTYLKNEPLCFHYQYKIRKRLEKVREKFMKSWVKVRCFYRFVVTFMTRAFFL
jgi:hypothetical protein